MGNILNWNVPERNIVSVEHGFVLETHPAKTELTIHYSDGTTEKIGVIGEEQYKKYRPYIKNPYPHHMG
jgi:hypothetical protein